MGSKTLKCQRCSKALGDLIVFILGGCCGLKLCVPCARVALKKKAHRTKVQE